MEYLNHITVYRLLLLLILSLGSSGAGRYLKELHWTVSEGRLP
jgi:hypothetical protein